MAHRNNRNWIAPALIWIAAAYFVVGIVLGIGMSVAHDYQLSPVHAHVNLLGWASLGLCGVIYRLWPAAAASPLALWHFWLHNLGLAPMMALLAAYNLGHTGVESVLAALSIVTSLGILVFAVNVSLNVRSEDT